MDTQAKLAELERRLTLLERVENVDNIKFLKEEVIGIKTGANDAAVDVVNNFTVSLITGNGSVTTLDYPDGFLKLKLSDGTLVYLPYYSGTRF